jgi:hypothetical protein
LERRRDWGRRRSVRREERMELAREVRPEAFSMMELGEVSFVMFEVGGDVYVTCDMHVKM